MMNVGLDVGYILRLIWLNDYYSYFALDKVFVNIV